MRLNFFLLILFADKQQLFIKSTFVKKKTRITFDKDFFKKENVNKKENTIFFCLFKRNEIR